MEKVVLISIIAILLIALLVVVLNFVSVLRAQKGVIKDLEKQLQDEKNKPCILQKKQELAEEEFEKILHFMSEHVPEPRYVSEAHRLMRELQSALRNREANPTGLCEIAAYEFYEKLQKTAHEFR